MDLYPYIKILSDPKKIFLSQEAHAAARIAALRKIADEGNAALIIYLTPFLKDNDKQIRDLTCETIIRLFKKISSKKGYYDALKNCLIFTTDIDFYAQHFSNAQYLELLTISSLNRDGYVREKAVERLTQASDPVVIPFLIYRLADWVKPVQQTALKGIEQYTTVQYIEALIENLPLLEWLQKVQRTDLSIVYKKIISFVASGNRDYIIANFKAYPDKIRLLLAKHLSVSVSESSKELGLLLNDKHFMVRSLVFEHFNKLDADAIHQLLHDKSAKIRLQVLYIFKKQNGFEHTVKNYLADNSATIRHFARFHLQKATIDFVDAKQYIATIKNYLHNKKVSIRKTAFLALWQLDEDNAYPYALENLDSPFTGLRNLAISFLSRAYTTEVLTKARKIYADNNQDFKKSMLKLFSQIGGLIAIPDLLLATIDEDEDIRQLAMNYLQLWRARAIRYFRTSKEEDVDQARKVFVAVYDVHKSKHYFQRNPIIGLDFFLK